MIPIEQSVIYQIPVDQITGLAKYGLALSCTAVSDLAESDLEKYVPPRQSAGNGPSPTYLRRLRRLDQIL